MKTYRSTPESVIRALDNAKSNGLIRGWQRNPLAPWPNGTSRPFSVFIEPVDGDTIEAKNLREATIACAMLASAHHAVLRLLSTYALTDSVIEQMGEGSRQRAEELAEHGVEPWPRGGGL
jgi:hypothetical protein